MVEHFGEYCSLRPLYFELKQHHSNADERSNIHLCSNPNPNPKPNALLFSTIYSSVRPQEVWKQYAVNGDLGDLAKEQNRTQAVQCLNHLITDALECIPECLGAQTLTLTIP